MQNSRVVLRVIKVCLICFLCIVLNPLSVLAGELYVPVVQSGVEGSEEKLYTVKGTEGFEFSIKGNDTYKWEILEDGVGVHEYSVVSSEKPDEVWKVTVYVTNDGEKSVVVVDPDGEKDDGIYFDYGMSSVEDTESSNSDKGNEEGSQVSEDVETGDNSNSEFWVVLFGISCICLVAVLGKLFPNGRVGG